VGILTTTVRIPKNRRNCERLTRCPVAVPRPLDSHVNFLTDIFMSDFVSVAKVGDIPDGEARTFPVNGRMVAVFNSDGELHAINDTCPHMGASLATGHVEDGAVTCPWHAWRYCIKNGTWLDNPNPKLATDSYELRVEGDDVQVLVPDPPPRSATPESSE